MSIYNSKSLGDASDFDVRVGKDVRQERKAMRRALKEVEASEGQLAVADALFGFERPTSLDTDARYASFPFKFARTVDALRQVKAADPRVEAAFQRFPFDQNNVSSRKGNDLASHKRALEPQLKRSYDAYLAKFGVQFSEAGVLLVANVIGLNFHDSGTGEARPARRSAKTPLKPSLTLKPSNADRDLMICAAELWTPRNEHDPTDQSAQNTIELMVYRSLLRTDRICFGYGLGRRMMRRIIAQLTARATADDILDRSPLQPEAIPSFLASLPIDEEGTTATLPPIKLP